jgi:hypothetical protein
MTSIQYVTFVSFFLLGLILLIFTLRSRKRSSTKKAATIRCPEADQPLDVWLCRHCGFKSLTSGVECSWCGAPKPEDPLSQTISPKEFNAQVDRPLPKRYDQITDAVA